MDTRSPKATETRAARIVIAKLDAMQALVEFSDAIHAAHWNAPDDDGGDTAYDNDEAIRVAYRLAYDGPCDPEGIPTGLLTHDDGDRLLVLAANIRHQIEGLVDLSCEVPSDYVPPAAS